MNTSGDDRLLNEAKRQLDRHADALDEVTVKRLEKIRRQALHTGGHRQRRWMAGVATAAAAALLIAVMSVMQTTRETGVDRELWFAHDDIDVIEELDFYAWLEATQPNS